MYSAKHILLVIIIIAIVLLIIGAVGYYYILGKDWVDSFYTSALTMAGLSLEAKPISNDQKIFIAIFTILSVGFYLVLIAGIIACILEPILLQAYDRVKV